MTDLIADRAAHYGDPRPNHERIAGLWTAYLGTPVAAHDVAMMMVLVKLSRAKVDPAYGDNYVDAHGYLEIAERLA